MASPSNLILGTLWNCPVAEARIFVESLRRHCEGDAMIVVASQGSEALVKFLRDHCITPIYFDSPYWMVLEIQYARYVRYFETLRGLDKTYDRVLLTDVSDVVFQGDPFADLPEDKLLCFLETPGRIIGQCATNSMWIRQVFGEEMLERMKRYEISCSGTTLGTQAAIIDYIGRLLNHAKPAIMAKNRQNRGHDQGVHNVMLRTGELPDARLIPNGQHVYTMASTPNGECKLGPNGTLIAPSGRLCPIVHQYNYKPEALAHVLTAYPPSM